MTPCIPWPGAVNAKGYGMEYVGAAIHMAHRMAYERAHGAIPHGMVIDHTCHNGTTCHAGDECPHRRCVNPDHLEAVPSAVNILRGNGLAGMNARKTHCKNGHEFTPSNTHVYADGRRNCKTCQTVLRRRYEAKRRTPRQDVAA